MSCLPYRLTGGPTSKEASWQGEHHVCICSLFKGKGGTLGSRSPTSHPRAWRDLGFLCLLPYHSRASGPPGWAGLLFVFLDPCFCRGEWSGLGFSRNGSDPVPYFASAGYGLWDWAKRLRASRIFRICRQEISCQPASLWRTMASLKASKASATSSGMGGRSAKAAGGSAG